MDSAPAPAAAADEEDLGKEVEGNPAFAAFGPRFKSCKAVAVTEEDTEYDISCVKHIFGEHIVLQFNCMNTIADQVCSPPCAWQRVKRATSHRRSCVYVLPAVDAVACVLAGL